MASIAMGFAYYAEIKSQKETRCTLLKYIVDNLTQLLALQIFMHIMLDHRQVTFQSSLKSDALLPLSGTFQN